MGTLYRRKQRDGALGRIWWAKYYVNGRPIRESTGIASRRNQGPPQEAKRFLKEREGRAAAGLPTLPRADRVRYDEAAADLKEHYKATGSRNLGEAGWRLDHLDRFFRGRRLVDISGALVTRYVTARQAEKASNATINRGVAVLGRMLRLAYEHGKLFRLPVMHKPKEAAPRQGFFESEQFQTVRRRLTEDLQAAVSIAYAFGWRMQSEVLTLERRQLDLEAGTLRLDPGTTKNDDGRVVYLPPDLKRLLAEQVERVRGLERQLGRIIPWLFPHLARRMSPSG